MPQSLIPSMDPRSERRVGHPEGVARRVAELERRVGGYSQRGDVFNQALPFAAGWSNYGGGWADCTYSRYGRLVVVGGLANKASAPSAGETIATLPAGFRPSSGKLIFNQMAVQLMVRIDIDTNGLIIWSAGPGGAQWVNLTGISFLL